MTEFVIFSCVILEWPINGSWTATSQCQKSDTTSAFATVVTRVVCHDNKKTAVKVLKDSDISLDSKLLQY